MIQTTHKIRGKSRFLYEIRTSRWQLSKDIRINAKGMCVLLEASTKAGVTKFAHLSTVEVSAALPQTGLITEFSSPFQITPHSASKAASDMLASA
jgi:dTDP-D-glucose 4,6-dehydratase